jgi:hypothetical protein
VNQTPIQHLADVQTCHDCLAGTRIVGEQEPEPALQEHVVVNCQPLVGKRVDAGYFRGEGGIKQVTVCEALALGNQPYTLRVGAKIQLLWRSGCFV